MVEPPTTPARHHAKAPACEHPPIASEPPLALEATANSFVHSLLHAGAVAVGELRWKADRRLMFALAVSRTDTRSLSIVDQLQDSNATFVGAEMLIGIIFRPHPQQGAAVN